MRFSILTTALALGFSSTLAVAQSSTTAADAPSNNMKLSQAECTNLWQQAKGTAIGLTAAQVAPFIADFKAANPDGNATIDQNEWMAACNKGLVKSSSSSGASTGASGTSTPAPAPAPAPAR